MSPDLSKSNRPIKWHSLTDYLMKTEVGDNVKIYVTNKKYLWQTVLDREELIRISKNQNAAMEGSDDSFLAAASQLLTEDPKNIEYKVEMVETNIKFSLRTSVQGFSFGLELQLEQATQEQYYKEITLALLASIRELQTQKEHLIKIVQAKDEEIGEYKLNGATLFRKCVATKYFNKEEFLSKSNKDSATGCVQFQPDTVLGDTLTEYHTIQGKYEKKEDKKAIAIIKTEPGTVSSEPSASNRTNRLSRPESPVLPLAKRPRKGKLASLI
uniref:Non-homologous end-joining factor 1 n=1 Tax=Cacopsylla melanoneura TaxID=428564 RepID=A0A8D8T8E2_9HEMI